MAFNIVLTEGSFRKKFTIKSCVILLTRLQLRHGIFLIEESMLGASVVLILQYIEFQKYHNSFFEIL